MLQAVECVFPSIELPHCGRANRAGRGVPVRGPGRPGHGCCCASGSCDNHSGSQYCIHIAHVSTLLQLRRAWQTDRLRICVAVSADLLMIPRAYVSADCGMDVQRTQDEQSKSTCAPLLRINTC
jgi:hypothetical protein